MANLLLKTAAFFIAYIAGVLTFRTIVNRVKIICRVIMDRQQVDLFHRKIINRVLQRLLCLSIRYLLKKERLCLFHRNMSNLFVNLTNFRNQSINTLFAFLFRHIIAAAYCIIFIHNILVLSCGNAHSLPPGLIKKTRFQIIKVIRSLFKVVELVRSSIFSGSCPSTSFTRLSLCISGIRT